jgi:hypothetical protein
MAKGNSDTTAQANKDAGGFTTTVEDMLQGRVKSYDEGGTMEVGDGYGLDPLGKTKVKHPNPDQ